MMFILQVVISVQTFGVQSGFLALPYIGLVTLFKGIKGQLMPDTPSLECISVSFPFFFFCTCFIFLQYDSSHFIPQTFLPQRAEVEIKKEQKKITWAEKGSPPVATQWKVHLHWIIFVLYSGENHFLESPLNLCRLRLNKRWKQQKNLNYSWYVVSPGLALLSARRNFIDFFRLASTLHDRT